MSKEQRPRLRRLNIRLHQAEYDKIAAHSAGTTSRSVSEYCRKILTDKPVRVYYRNKSFDEFEQHIIHLLPILQEHSSETDRLIKLLSTLENIPEINANIVLILHGQRHYVKILEEIKDQLIKISDKCAQ